MQTNPYPYIPPPNIESVLFLQDTRNHTLIVRSVPINYTMLWDNVTLEGQGVLPSGTIDIGDMITECRGEINLNIRYKSNYTLHPTYTFKIKEDELPKFVGTWKSEKPSITRIFKNGEVADYEGRLIFNSNGTFVKNQTGYPISIGTWELEYTEVQYGGGDEVDNDLMLVVNDTNTSVYKYSFDVYEGGIVKLSLRFNGFTEDTTFLDALLIKQ